MDLNYETPNPAITAFYPTTSELLQAQAQEPNCLAAYHLLTNLNHETKQCLYPEKQNIASTLQDVSPNHWLLK